jgi:hypothetical protein
MWIDHTHYSCASIVLLKIDGELILETHYYDESKSSKKLRSTAFTNKTRYDDYEPNINGEYFEVNENGVLNYYTENGIFLILKPFEKKTIYSNLQ